MNGGAKYRNSKNLTANKKFCKNHAEGMKWEMKNFAVFRSDNAYAISEFIDLF